MARAAARGLDNIAFEEGSILELPRSGLGPFDYVDCCGVLHHLPDPAAGLAALVATVIGAGTACSHCISPKPAAEKTTMVRRLARNFRGAMRRVP
jgi:2-polyprenyl-3-methyl-5-hydroxy-6-metoxy-1,4-benzoquinol methylase